MAVRETKKQCRILRISAEHNTSVRITDDVSLLNQIPHFSVQFLNKMRTGRRWRKPKVQFGEEVWFRKIGDDGVSSFASRGKSWTRQTLSGAWESTCGTPWQMVAPELKLTKRVTADKEGAGPRLPRIVVERAPEAEPRRFYVLSADIEAHGHIGACPGCEALASHGKATKPHNDECRERIRTIIERTLTGEARMSAYKDRIVRQSESKRGKELE